MNYKIAPIDFNVGKMVIETNHYSHKMPQAVKATIGLKQEDSLLGVIVYSIPANRFVFSCLGLPNGWELSRVWTRDDLPRNTLSRFISKTLQNLPVDLVVSFADPQFGHLGYIYQAVNFIYIGQTHPEKRYILDGKLITRRGLGRKKGISEAEDRQRILAAGATEFLSKPKHKYIYIRDKKDRKVFLSTHELKPYPKGIQ